MVVCPRCGKLNDTSALCCTQCSQPLQIASAPLIPPPVQALPVPSPNTMRSPARKSSGSAAHPLQTHQCLVCGWTIQTHARAPICPRCRIPIGSVANPNDITSSGILLYAGKPVALTPLTESDIFSPVALPVPLTWNLGAAFCTIPWTIVHKRWGWATLCTANLALWLVLLVDGDGDFAHSTDGVINVLTILCASFWLYKTLYFALSGHIIARSSGRYVDLDALQKAQRKWTLRAGVPCGVAIFIMILKLVL